MTLLHARRNGEVTRAIVAVIRAYARMPDFNFARAKETAVQIEQVVKDVRKIEVIFALGALLLKGIGVQDVSEDIDLN